MKVAFVAHRGGDNQYLETLASHLHRLSVTVEWVSPRPLVGIVSLFYCDIVHFHWVEPLVLRPQTWKSWPLLIYWTLVLLVLRIASKGIVITIHNIYPHESSNSLIYRRMINILIQFSHYIICFNQEQADKVSTTFSTYCASKLKIVPHGLYSFTSQSDQDKAKQQLGIGTTQPLFVYLGTIRPYKGLETLIQALSNVNRSCAVYIAGWGSEQYLTEVGTQLKALPDNIQVHYHPGPQAAATLLTSLNAADVLVLPFRQVFNSGSLWMALSAKKMIITSRQPTLKSLLLLSKVWTYKPGDVKQLAELLTQALQRTPRERTEIGQESWNQVNTLSPQRIATLHKNIYETI